MNGIIIFIIGMAVGGAVGAILMGLICANEMPVRKKWWEDDE